MKLSKRYLGVKEWSCGNKLKGIVVVINEHILYTFLFPGLLVKKEGNSDHRVYT